MLQHFSDLQKNLLIAEFSKVNKDTWGYVHGERGKGSVEEEENEEERNDRGEGVQTKAATMCAKIVERSARREISAERGGRTAEIKFKRKNGTHESETATQSTAGGVILHLKSSEWLEVFSPWCLRAAENRTSASRGKVSHERLRATRS